MLFDRCYTKNQKRSFKQHIKYVNFRSKMVKYHVNAVRYHDSTG